MKKLLIIFIYLCCNFLQAQTWCPPGATWHYDVNAPMYPYYSGKLELKYTDTATINNKLCKKMVGTYSGQLYSAHSPSTIVNNYVVLNTYEDNELICNYDPVTNKFDTIANYNASIGDSWLLAIYPGYTMVSVPCPEKPLVNVINTGTVSLNNVTLKMIVVSYTLQYSTNYSFVDTLIEKIGSIGSFLLPYYDCTQHPKPMGKFICYSDSTFPLYSKPGVLSCDYDPTGVNEYENNTFVSIAPNPVKDKLMLRSLHLNGRYEATLINSLGEQVLQNNQTYVHANHATELDISDLKPGFYFLVLSENNVMRCVKKIIKE